MCLGLLSYVENIHALNMYSRVLGKNSIDFNFPLHAIDFVVIRLIYTLMYIKDICKMIRCGFIMWLSGL